MGTTSKTFVLLRKGATGPDLNRGGAGAEQWHGESAAVIPMYGTYKQEQDVYHRFVATRLEGSTQGSYNWQWFDGLIIAAIQKRQKVSFGIMTVYTDMFDGLGGAYYDGANAAYPQWLHNKMKADPNTSMRDWKYGNTWIPNYNSPHYHAWLLALHTALNSHIMATSYNGVAFKNVVHVVDIRGWGNWGECHHYGYTANNDVNSLPAGLLPTVASLKAIVDAHTKGFPDFPLVAMIAAYDAQWLRNTWNPAEIAWYLLTQKNNWGYIGWRRDQWAATDGYLKSYLEENNRSFNGMVFKNEIMNRWKLGAITGEPAPYVGNADDLERQVILYHANSFGNGNFGVSMNTTLQANVIKASIAAGYWFVFKDVKIETALGLITVRLNIQNIGGSVSIEDWDLVYEVLDAAGAMKFTSTSKFVFKFFQPQALPTLVVDEIRLPVDITGKLTVRAKIKDRKGYRPNMPLGIEGELADGAYLLGEADTGVVTPPPPPANKPPVVTIGANQVITRANTTISGVAVDSDGSVQALEWTLVSGTGNIISKNSGTTVVEGMSLGINTFRLTATDNLGLKGYRDMTVTVKEPDPIPQRTAVKVSLTYNDGYVQEGPIGT